MTDPSTPASIPSTASHHGHHHHKRRGHNESQPGLDPIPLPKPQKRQATWLLYWASINPIICGALGPVLTLLALAGCTDSWRVFWNSDGTSFSERDPRWVIASTAVAISVGVFANIFLLLRMMARGNPAFNQYMSIALWLLESIINFVTVGVYDQIVGNDGDWEYAQGFWMTTCSAAMSFICAIFLALNSFILPEFGKRGKMGLSGPQRVFVIQIMIFILWLAIGAAIFYGVEHFTFSESIYFVDVTVTTVGFGDNIVPTTTLGRAVVMPYAIIGIISLGLVISSIRTVVVERGHIRKRLVAMVIKRHQKRLKALQKHAQRRQASVMGVSMMVMGPHLEGIHQASLKPFKREASEKQTREKRLEKAEKLKEFYDLAFAFLAFAIFWLVGGIIFSSTEGWTYFEGLYFCMIFFLTIGYGDFVVTSNAGRAIYIVYSLLTIPIMTILVSLMSDSVLSKFQRSAENFGMRGGEDKKYQKKKELKKEPPKWKDRLKIFHLKKEPGKSKVKDLENGGPPLVDSMNDEILRDRIMEEVEEIERKAGEGVDMGIGDEKEGSGVLPLEAASSTSGTRKRTLRNMAGEAPTEMINEEDVDRVMRQTREKEFIPD